MAYAAHHSLRNSHAAPPSASPLAGIANWVSQAAARWQQRRDDARALEWMDERDLRDARMTRWAIEREAARPFWRE
jgi:uncharacterized protein YjiS (DUF1127 family)